jgi:hypothetical protein
LRHGAIRTELDTVIAAAGPAQACLERSSHRPYRTKLTPKGTSE